ncbi:hypothetical protein HDU99_004564, partial [Rhizoclosmatium hyalinum]
LLPQTTCNLVVAENGDSMTEKEHEALPVVIQHLFKSKWKDSDVTFDAWTATQIETFECVKKTPDSITLDDAGAKVEIEPPVDDQNDCDIPCMTSLDVDLAKALCGNFNLRVETETERLLIVEEESVLKKDSVEDSNQTTDHIPDDRDHIISPLLLASELILSIWPMKPSERANPFTLFPLDVSAPQTPTCVSLVNDDVTLINPDQDISGNHSAFTIYNPPLSPKTKLANEIGQVEELNQPAISSRIDSRVLGTMVMAADFPILRPLQKPVAHISDIGRAGMVSRIPIAKSQPGIPIQNDLELKQESLITSIKKSNYESDDDFTPTTNVIHATASKSENQPSLKEKKLGKPETALLFSPKRKRAAAVASNAKTKDMFESLGPKGGTKRKYHKE